MTSLAQHENLTNEQILQWYLDAGVDETIGATTASLYGSAPEKLAPPPQSHPTPQPAKQQPAVATIDFNGQRPAVNPLAENSVQAAKNAHHAANSAQSLAELKSALEGFEGCNLKNTAHHTVFGTGSDNASLMIIGEAPGREEDQQGLPFVGPSGQLLDAMLKSIGLDRTTSYISNVIPWRPPGNRKPTEAETNICLPFIRRHIELVQPRVLLLLGGSAASAILSQSASITRLRGKWHNYETPALGSPVKAMASFHPAYLLRQPAQKKRAWNDLLMVAKELGNLKQDCR